MYAITSNDGRELWPLDVQHRLGETEGCHGGVEAALLINEVLRLRDLALQRVEDIVRAVSGRVQVHDAGQRVLHDQLAVALDLAGHLRKVCAEEVLVCRDHQGLAQGARVRRAVEGRAEPCQREGNYWTLKDEAKIRTGDRSNSYRNSVVNSNKTINMRNYN